MIARSHQGFRGRCGVPLKGIYRDSLGILWDYIGFRGLGVERFGVSGFRGLGLKGFRGLGLQGFRGLGLRGLESRVGGRSRGIESGI